LLGGQARMLGRIRRSAGFQRDSSGARRVYGQTTALGRGLDAGRPAAGLRLASGRRRPYRQLDLPPFVRLPFWSRLRRMPRVQVFTGRTTLEGWSATGDGRGRSGRQEGPDAPAVPGEGWEVQHPYPGGGVVAAKRGGRSFSPRGGQARKCGAPGGWEPGWVSSLLRGQWTGPPRPRRTATHPPGLARDSAAPRAIRWWSRHASYGSAGYSYHSTVSAAGPPLRKTRTTGGSYQSRGVRDTSPD